jgi:predicted SAM-dependent methyltransferase
MNKKVAKLVSLIVPPILFPQTVKSLIRNLKLKMNYHGKTCFCPCCGERFGHFKDFDHTYEQWKGWEAEVDLERLGTCYKKVICPYCGSFPRHRIVTHYFMNNRHLLTNNTNGILMFAAEWFLYKLFSEHTRHITMADLSHDYANVLMDIQKTPFLDETWELITCNHVLEHVADYKVALKELHRILKKEGVLEIMVPVDSTFEKTYEDASIVDEAGRIKHFGQFDHVRIFGQDFADRLEEAGFIVETINGNDLPEEICPKIGPANYEDNRIYICRKQ